ncbi:MAG: TatD family hydrolase [Patescibacteria group bacterium]
MLPKYFDIHAHPGFKGSSEEKKEIIEEALNESVWVINVGTNFFDSQDGLELAENYEQGVYATAGLFPESDNTSILDRDRFRSLASSDKVVAIGECGLDYFHTTDPEEIRKQKELFILQIEVANELKKPLMLHIRNGSGGNAYADAIPILKERSLFGGNAHFFAGTIDDEKALLDMGFSVSFTGVITFTDDYNEAVRFAPLDMIMSETDAPFVAPMSVRGKENKPVYVKETAKKIAEIRGQSEDEVLPALVSNACRIFNICSFL